MAPARPLPAAAMTSARSCLAGPSSQIQLPAARTGGVALGSAVMFSLRLILETPVVRCPADSAGRGVQATVEVYSRRSTPAHVEIAQHNTLQPLRGNPAHWQSSGRDAASSGRPSPKIAPRGWNPS